MNDTDNKQSGLCAAENHIAAQLKRLKSLITHSRNIEEDAEALVRSLGEQYIDPGFYPVDSVLAVNLQHFREMLADNYGFHFREFFITSLGREAAVIFLEGMANEELINTHIIERLTAFPLAGSSPLQHGVVACLKNTLVTAASLTEVSQMDQAVKLLLTGDTILLVDGVAALIVVASRKLKTRAITEPEAESNIRAPREGFVEELQTNLSLLRRRLKNPNLIVKTFAIGRRSNTAVAVVYFRGITDLRLVCEVERRLKRISIDAPTSSGLIENIMEDHPYSPFSTMLATERPDKVAAALVEGKVAIIMEGFTFVLVAPATFGDFFQSSDDYNEKWLAASLFRFLRYLSALFSIITPALYVAVTTFHPGMIPTPLTITIGNARLGIPFPAFIEALLMEALLEVLQEAGVRLPKSIGPAVSIVGGLVIGEATVRAGLVSAPIVIVTAFTAIASFNIANYRINLIVRLLRLPFLILGASFGMFGIMVGLIAVAMHLSHMESFGVPYLASLTPKNAAQLDDLTDTVIVAPAAMMDERPAYLSPEDVTRQKP